MRLLFDVPAWEVREAAEHVVLAQGSAEGWQLFDAVAARLGGVLTDRVSLGVDSERRYELSKAQNRWRGTVRRALRKLTDQGVVVMVPRRTTGPDGWAPNTVYYSPGAYKQAQEAGKQRRHEEAKLKARWNEIRKRLFNGPGVVLSNNLTLTAPEWEALLEKAGW